MAINLRPYQGVFGLPPPTSSLSDDMIRNSMPVLEIIPGEPNFSLGLSLFRINHSRGWKKYIEILANHGFTLGSSSDGRNGASGKPIRFAFIADNFPTDSFSNEYTETFLQKFTDVASSGLSQIIQMSGEKNATAALSSYGSSATQYGEAMGDGMLGKVLTGGGGMLQDVSGQLTKLQAAMKGSDSQLKRSLGGSMGLVDKMLAGHRIDFPQIWSNSGYSPSYSVTIRLYNPNPGNRESTLRYIAGPIAVILCLGVPRTDNGASYRWPFYHKIAVKGLYELNPAVITNITIVKGGDQQQIAFNQAMSIVDVRMDFISLHKSMLLEEDKPTSIDRPTVRNYIDQLTNDRGTITRAQMNNKNANIVGAPVDSQDVKQNSLTEDVIFQKNQAAAIRLPQTSDVNVNGSRVDSGDTTTEGSLISQNPAVYLDAVGT